MKLMPHRSEHQSPPGDSGDSAVYQGRSRSTPSTRLGLSAAGICSAFIAALSAAAWTIPTPAAAQVEIEADPFAYALNGFSLHAAGVFGSYRLSVGTFGIDVPRFFHGEDDWSVVMRGAGVKWDLLGARSDGFFVGVDASYMRMSYTLDEVAETEKMNEFNVGVRGGFRLPVGRSGLYLAPWVGIGYSFGDDVEVGGRTFEHSPIVVFPTVHVGWRF